MQCLGSKLSERNLEPTVSHVQNQTVYLIEGMIIPPLVITYTHSTHYRSRNDHHTHIFMNGLVIAPETHLLTTFQSFGQSVPCWIDWTVSAVDFWSVIMVDATLFKTFWSSFLHISRYVYIYIDINSQNSTSIWLKWYFGMLWTAHNLSNSLRECWFLDRLRGCQVADFRLSWLSRPARNKCCIIFQTCQELLVYIRLWGMYVNNNSHWRYTIKQWLVGVLILFLIFYPKGDTHTLTWPTQTRQHPNRGLLAAKRRVVIYDNQLLLDRIGSGHHSRVRNLHLTKKHNHQTLWSRKKKHHHHHHHHHHHRHH